MATRSGGVSGLGFDKTFGVTEVDRVGIEADVEFSAGYGNGLYGVAFSYDPADGSWSNYVELR